mmetsp:Transcript_9012/g.31827  ORF Transcript_9012/g.31827 Transcript_9012/m.31827 type:complete len:400 (-) Transcript_9012:482-1681(-)
MSLRLMILTAYSLHCAADTPRTMCFANLTVEKEPVPSVLPNARSWKRSEGFSVGVSAITSRAGSPATSFSFGWMASSFANTAASALLNPSMSSSVSAPAAATSAEIFASLLHSRRKSSGRCSRISLSKLTRILFTVVFQCRSPPFSSIGKRMCDVESCMTAKYMATNFLLLHSCSVRCVNMAYSEVMPRISRPRSGPSTGLAAAGSSNMSTNISSSCMSSTSLGEFASVPSGHASTSPCTAVAKWRASAFTNKPTQSTSGSWYTAITGCVSVSLPIGRCRGTSSCVSTPSCTLVIGVRKPCMMQPSTPSAAAMPWWPMDVRKKRLTNAPISRRTCGRAGRTALYTQCTVLFTKGSSSLALSRDAETRRRNRPGIQLFGSMRPAASPSNSGALDASVSTI